MAFFFWWGGGGASVVGLICCRWSGRERVLGEDVYMINTHVYKRARERGNGANVGRCRVLSAPTSRCPPSTVCLDVSLGSEAKPNTFEVAVFRTGDLDFKYWLFFFAAAARLIFLNPFNLDVFIPLAWQMGKAYWLGVNHNSRVK